MPDVVAKVDDPWEPYMDGRLYRFTQAEFVMIPRFEPMRDEDTGDYVGPRQFLRSITPYIYVRFVTTPPTYQSTLWQNGFEPLCES